MTCRTLRPSILTLLAFVAALSGCESVDQAVTQAKTSAAAAFAPAASAPRSSPVKSPGIAGTELDGIFKRHPLTNSQGRDNYPRAAITIVSATPSILKRGPGTVDQCVRFNVRLWTNSKTSRVFDGLQMCEKDKSFDVPFRTLTYWPNSYVTGETTGAMRTEGPKRPKTNFPTGSRVATAWFESDTRGLFYVGSILYQMGYDWDQPGEDRAWFVSVPSP